MTKWLKNLWKDESGVTAVEYGLIIALLAIAAIGAWITLSDNTPTNSVQETPTAESSTAE